MAMPVFIHIYPSRTQLPTSRHSESMPIVSISIIRDGKPFSDPKLLIDNFKTVLRLKRDIRSTKGVAVDEQYLSFYKEVLQDDRTLESYGIDEGSKISLILQTPGAMQISYQISEKQDVIRVRRKDTISQIKEKIAQKEKLNSKQFYLTDVSNKRLDDNITVEGAGIKVNGHLYCKTIP